MEKCKAPPPLFQLNEHQAASCYLYGQNPEVPRERLMELMPI